MMKWIRETGGDIENESGKTRFYMAAEVKINLYLGNYARAGDILQLLVPYFENDTAGAGCQRACFRERL